MLGHISMKGAPGEVDLLLSNLAARLEQDGLLLAGAVQINIDLGAETACDMDLRILGDDGPAVRISQSLGPGSQGCRLDAGALETAVARVQHVLTRDVQLVIVNKFAKQEAYGRGFRDIFAAALERDLPVLTYVPEDYAGDFAQFAGDFACPVAPDTATEWCRQAILSRTAA